jgi:hypothetical protein
MSFYWFDEEKSRTEISKQMILFDRGAFFDAVDPC